MITLSHLNTYGVTCSNEVPSAKAAWVGKIVLAKGSKKKSGVILDVIRVTDLPSPGRAMYSWHPLRFKVKWTRLKEPEWVSPASLNDLSFAINQTEESLKELKEIFAAANS